jgi:CRP/FNR family transcriptional regulator, nitrogen oxide reductase regulator
MEILRAAGPEEQALSKVPPFRALSPEDRRRLAPYVRVKQHAPGEIVFREGAPSDRFYTVVEGRVKVVKFAPHGKELILEIFGAGDPFGAVAAYEGVPFPASAVTLTSCCVLSIARREFFMLLEKHPEIARGLLLGLTHRLLELTHKLAQLSSGGVEERIASFFLKTAERIGEPRGGHLVIPMALSRQDIADMVGTTIETAIRVMSRWNRDGIVTTGKGSFTVRDMAALRRLAEGEEPPSAGGPCAR